MKTYLQKNENYWAKGYSAENVESFVFRPFGRIFEFEFGLTGKNKERILDFGCGQGAALRFFKQKGFDVYGVDISKKDIQICKNSMREIKNHFKTIPAKPSASDNFFKKKFDLIISIQTLYYLSDRDLELRLKSLHGQLKNGGYIYATMIGKKHYLFRNARKQDGGLYKVSFRSPRLDVKDYFVNFTHSETELLEKFKLFEKKHIGFYDARYREDEGGSFHYTFIGKKVSLRQA